MAEKLEIIQHESLTEALLCAQSEYPPLDKASTVNVKTRDGGSYSYKYADLAYTKKMTDPYLWKHGLVVSGGTQYRDGKEFQVDRLRHVHSKEEDVSEVEITESDMKQFGGNSTYAKRYNYHNLTGRVGEDDSESRPLQNRRQPSRPPDKQKQPSQGAPKPTAEDEPIDPKLAALRDKVKGEEGETMKRWGMSRVGVRTEVKGSKNLNTGSVKELEIYSGQLERFNEKKEQELVDAMGDTPLTDKEQMEEDMAGDDGYQR